MKKGLDEAIKDILDDFDKGVVVSVQDAVKAATKAGLREVKSNTSIFRRRTGMYRKGWRSRVENGRMTASGVIYNASLPGLPHLLEFGHATRNGGRVPGRMHIAPVQDLLEREFFQEMERRI